MAGIGFALRKLTQQDDFIGVFKGYSHCALASAGPWVFTILSLGAITILGSRVVSEQELVGFRLLIIYNFAFSLVFSGPVVMVATRYLSDLIYAREVSGAAGMMLGSLGLLYATQALLVGPFYFLYLKADFWICLAGFINFFLITGIWLVSQFLSSLKDYGSVSRSFAGGMLLGLIAAVVLAPIASVAGMILGFSMGLALILFSLIARIFAEYPRGVIAPLGILRYFAKYWEIAASGLVYNLAIWIDKWILWFSPRREVLAFSLFCYPDYDGAMFLAYLTILPSMALFVFSIETEFFEQYLRFYRDIPRHATFAKIEANHQQLIQVTLDSSRTFFVVQGSITLTVLFLAPKIFELLGISFSQLGVFRFGVLGALFHALFLFLSIFLAYFDLRRVTLALQLLFLLANGGFSWLSMLMGFPYYGSGYLMASLVSFLCAFFATQHYLNHLPYYTFIRSSK